MAGNLVIVESPGKTGTIQKFLGSGFVVKASKGHIRDLPEKSIGVDIDNGFCPDYIIPEDKKKTVSELKKAAQEADIVWLASDEDREGEAISWHLFSTLGLDKSKTRRIVFHEITKTAIDEAIRNPRDINMNLVNAQQARRVLDRIVGYELSPVLWRKCQPGLSAGRVQSVALRLIVDREREISAFKKEPFYRIEADFHPEGCAEGIQVKAVLDSRFRDLESAREFLSDCIGANFTVTSVETKEALQNPAAPFTTSTLQQEAARRLHMSVSQIMKVAQTLYEKGLITYMRTDSTILSGLALNTAREFICGKYGPEYSKTRQYTTKTLGAQEAHEAIRPTYIDRTSVEGTRDEKALYELIWKRTVASQMASAKIQKTDVKIGSDRRKETFSAQGTVILFDGFRKLYSSDDDPEELVVLPGLYEGTGMLERGMSAVCRFTAPPQRYSEGTLVKKLEELRIGRPSTYVPTISTLTKGRGYVVKGDKDGEKVRVTNLSLRNGKISSSEKFETIGAEKGKLIPQDIGLAVTDFLVEGFNDILDYGFTAKVEEDFDRIAGGDIEWNTPLASFYETFHRKIEESRNNAGYLRVSREIGIDPSDGKLIVARLGQYGPFVQKGEGEDKVCASLGKGQNIESLCLEDALKLFKLPRKVGDYEGFEIIASSGRFGPYIKWNGKNFSLPRHSNPISVDIDTCIKAIRDVLDRPANAVISEFPGDIQVVQGNYGPYIKHAGKNYRIPHGTDAAKLTEEDCRKIVSESQPTIRNGRRK